MANPEYLAKLAEGVEAWNPWRRESAELRPDLRGAELSSANLSSADLRGADLRSANLSSADLSSANLSEANLDNANLIGANLRYANLRYANLSGANLSGAAPREANVFRANCIGAYERGADLRGADLRGAELCFANLMGAALGGADLRHANLGDANLLGVELRGADLTGAELIGANLVNADMRGSNLSGANLRYANLDNANLHGADLSGAEVGLTTWANTDLSGALNIELIHHDSPSSVGIDSLILSRGLIPDVFLRGCGVPEHIIAMQKSLVAAMSPIQFYSCFISYSHQDEDFAKRLHGRLQQAGLRVWFAPEDMKGGRKVHEQIDDAIRVHDKLLLVVSEASMASEWVATEMRKARKREATEKRRVLFPIRLTDFDAIKPWECFDADTGKDMAVEVREYYVPDFSNWKEHDRFEAEVEKLLRDLTASATTPIDASAH